MILWHFNLPKMLGVAEATTVAHNAQEWKWCALAHNQRNSTQSAHIATPHQKSNKNKNNCFSFNAAGVKRKKSKNWHLINHLCWYTHDPLFKHTLPPEMFYLFGWKILPNVYMFCQRTWQMIPANSYDAYLGNHSWNWLACHSFLSKLLFWPPNFVIFVCFWNIFSATSQTINLRRKEKSTANGISWIYIQKELNINKCYASKR